jgi:HD-GYP domain-containing protein (c-di-GMP phosphodiesterase class II)
MHLDPKALLYAGLLHDIGKSLTDLKILQKTEGWTPHDAEEMKRHVADGCRILGGRFDFSREVIKLHHRFQREGYPKQLPKPLHEYSEGTKTMIALFGRLLALADCYDAMHRINDKLGQAPLTGQYIKEKMLEYNIDQRLLIEELYQAGIFTLHIETT